MIFLAFAFLGFLFIPNYAFAEWQSLISVEDFDGIRNDVLTASSGIITVLLIIVGIGLLVRTLGR